MSRSITLVRSNNITTTATGSYQLVLEITTANNTPKECFVKQRTNKPDNTVDDTFVAVASPVQLEDLNTVAPAKGSTYFRDSKISLVCHNAEFAEQVYSDIVAELNILLTDLAALDTLEVSQTVVLTA